MLENAEGNAKAISVRVKSLTGGKVGGSNKHTLRENPIPKYVDQDRMHLNSVIQKPLRATDLRELCKERRLQRPGIRALKKNASIAFEGIITFGKKAQFDFEQLSVDDQNKAYVEIAEAIAARVNTTVSGVVAHRDETAPHAHFQMPGFDLDGKPLSQSIKRNVTSEFQTIAANVIKRHVRTIERGRSKYERLANGADWSDVVNKSVRKLHHELPEDIAKLEEEREALLAKIDKNEKLAAKSAEKAARNDAAAKRVITYERRAETARQTLQALLDKISALEEKEKKLAPTEARIKDLERRSDELTEEIKIKENLAVDIIDKAQKRVAKYETAYKALAEAIKALVPAKLQAAISKKYRELLGTSPDPAEPSVTEDDNADNDEGIQP